MKGRITCPHCGHHIIAEINKTVPSFNLKCPECNHHFKVRTSQVDLSNVPSDSTVEVEADCDWEEHGEPRKTILSSIKPRTDKPMIAALFLIAVTIIGVAAAFFPTIYLQAPVQIISLGGVQGELTVFIDNESIVDPNDIMLDINQENVTFERENDFFYASNLSLGEHILTVQLVSNNSSAGPATKQVYVLPFNLSSNNIIITDTDPLTLDDSTYDLTWLSAILFILSVVVLIGATMSWRRKYSDVAFIGCVIGAISIGIYFTGLILSIIAFWLIHKSRDEFDDGKKGKSF